MRVSWRELKPELMATASFRLMCEFGIIFIFGIIWLFGWLLNCAPFERPVEGGLRAVHKNAEPIAGLRVVGG